jgi:transposase
MIDSVTGRPGRPRACSPEAILEVLRLSDLGWGTRSITSELKRRGIDLSRRSVQRVVNGEGVYKRLGGDPQPFPLP